MQLCHVCWVGTSFLFVGGMIYAYVCFLLESTRKAHLIPGVIVVSIGFFSVGKNLLFILSNNH